MSISRIFLLLFLITHFSTFSQNVPPITTKIQEIYVLPWTCVKYVPRVPLPHVVHGAQVSLEGGGADGGAFGEDEHLEDAVYCQQTQQTHQIAYEHSQEVSTKQWLTPVWWQCMWLCLSFTQRHCCNHHCHFDSRKYQLNYKLSYQSMRAVIIHIMA